MARATISFISVMLTNLSSAIVQIAADYFISPTNDTDYHKYFYYIADL